MPDFPIIELDFIDSTNNYAMQLIDANKAQPGLTIVAKQQARGKGQRGRSWIDVPGSSLLMSIIVTPKHTINEQFAFSASVAIAIANVLQKLSSHWHVSIKWPNDIIVNDKKAGGILIENILRGSQWTYSIIGIGLNVKQEKFPPSLPHATSLKLVSGVDHDMVSIRDSIHEHVQSAISSPRPTAEVMKSYNDLLYKRGLKQKLSDDTTLDWNVTVLSVLEDGRLEVKLQDGTKECYTHGQVNWEWEQ